MDEKHLITENGIFIIKPSNYKISISNCSVCGFALRHKEDTIEQNRIGCCLDCSLHFYQPNRVAWENGWRPTDEEVKKVIKNQIGE